MQKIFAFSHRWLGLVLGVHFVLLGLTGCYLVFDDRFETWVYPGRHSVETPAPTFDLQRLMTAAALPGPADRISIPEDPQRTVRIQFEKDVTYVDASNYVTRGRYARNDSLARWLLNFHRELLLEGRIGSVLVGISGLLLLGLLVSGLALFWPKSKRWQRALRWPQLRSFYKGSLDLHKLFGFYASLFMLLSVITGIYLANPGWFTFGKAEPKAEQPKVVVPDIEYNHLQASIEAQGLPLRPLTIIRSEREGRIIVRQKQMSFIYDGRMHRLIADPPKPETFSLHGLLHDLHTGAYAGVAGKVLAFLIGLLPLFLFITGFYVWNKRRVLAAKHDDLKNLKALGKSVAPRLW